MSLGGDGDAVGNGACAVQEEELGGTLRRPKAGGNHSGICWTKLVISPPKAANDHQVGRVPGKRAHGRNSVAKNTGLLYKGNMPRAKNKKHFL